MVPGCQPLIPRLQATCRQALTECLRQGLVVMVALLVLGCARQASSASPAAAPTGVPNLASPTATALIGPSPTSTRPAAPTPSAGPTSLPTAAASPLPTATAVPPPSPTTVTVGPLTMEEYAVVANEVDTPGHFEYTRRIDRQVLARREAWRSPSPATLADEANASLGRFGYRLLVKTSDERTLFDLYHGEEPVKLNLVWFRSPSVSAKGDDFAMLVGDSRKEYLIRNGSVAEWEGDPYSYTPPVYLGDDLLFVVMDHSEEKGAKLSVTRDGQTLHSVIVPGPLFDNPVKAFSAWNGRWVLEVYGQVWVDGQSLNQEPGYEEVFGWRLVAGKPFYLFRQTKGVPIGASYDGKDLPIRYDEVIHYRCCEPAAFNAQGNQHMVWFHALRDGTWYYVEIGSYGSSQAGSSSDQKQEARDMTVASAGSEPRLSDGTPALLQGTLEEAEEALRMKVRLPSYLPAGAEPDGQVRYYVALGQGMISLAYRVGQRALAIDYHTPPLEDARAGQGRVVPVGGFPALVYTQPKEPSDLLPAWSTVTWSDGPTIRVAGDLSVDELVAVAQSMYR